MWKVDRCWLCSWVCICSSIFFFFSNLKSVVLHLELSPWMNWTFRCATTASSYAATSAQCMNVGGTRSSSTWPTAPKPRSCVSGGATAKRHSSTSSTQKRSEYVPLNIFNCRIKQLQSLITFMFDSQCRELYYCVKDSMEKAAARQQSIKPGMKRKIWGFISFCLLVLHCHFILL